MPYVWAICVVYAIFYLILYLGIIKPMNLLNFVTKFKFEINCLALCHGGFKSRQNWTLILVVIYSFIIIYDCTISK